MIRGNALAAYQSVGKDEKATKCIQELLDALDIYIPEPVRKTDKPFLLSIEDVFSIKGSGTMVTGRVERGVVKVGEPLEIVGCEKVDAGGKRSSQSPLSNCNPHQFNPWDTDVTGNPPRLRPGWRDLSLAMRRSRPRTLRRPTSTQLAPTWEVNENQRELTIV